MYVDTKQPPHAKAIGLAWDVYKCDGGHKIIIENRSEIATDTVACPIDEHVAVYNGSSTSLAVISTVQKK